MRPVLILAVCGLSALILGCSVSASGRVAPMDRVTESDQSAEHRRAHLRLSLATAYLQQGQTLVALDEVKQALALAPDLSAAWHLRGVIYMQLGDVSRADPSFERAMALSPDDADLLHNYGWSLCRLPVAEDRHVRAQALLRRAAARSTAAQSAKSWLALAICQEQVGQTGQALDSLFQPALMTMADAPTLWQAAKLARKLDNAGLVARFGEQLRHRYGRSQQAAAFDKGAWDE